MSKVHYLGRLLDGAAVEWRALGNVADYLRGLVYSKSDESADSHGHKVLRANNITLSDNTLNFDEVKYVNQATKVKDEQRLRQDDILICAASGSREHVGKVAYVESDTDFYFGGFMGVVRCSTSLVPKYLFYVLSSDLFKKYLDDILDSPTINNLNSSVMNRFKVPIPCPDNPPKSLAIQAAIVRVLDSLTKSTTELTAELTIELATREKQYHHYRDHLLRFEDGKVEWTTLGDEALVEIANTARRPVKASLRIAGNIPYYGSNNVQDYVDGYTHDGEYVLVAEDGSASLESYSIQYAKGKFWANNHVHILRGKHGLSTRFLYHYLRMCDFNPYLPNKERAKLTKGDLLKIPIPIPSRGNTEESLRVQEKLVRILDKFDTLTNSIREELPREIALRQQQYAYYRDLLLSFPKQGEMAG